ncbi:hypothetical protein K9M47_01655 [Candidatus Gracilibacteria bacterium]|nr:hypothetical protein [Candidatus Gracilibacteria bacterium]MCF7898845.1 hypothetical protein [Candidatus Paceibacterota bacterium]
MKGNKNRGASHVAGYIRGLRLQKDGNLRFRILDQWFLVKNNGPFAAVISATKEGRAVVAFRFIEKKKHPNVLRVIADPTGQQVLEVSQQ